MGILRVENLTAGYGNREVLKNISFDLKKGEIVSFIGSNGAGKSTLLKNISGFLIPSSGRIILDNEDITRLSIRSRVKKGISYLMQGGEVFQRLTVAENLELGGWNQKNEKLKERVDKISSLFPELRTMMSIRAGLLSGGQKQMLALAIALVSWSRLLLLDEPFSALAPDITRYSMDTLRQLRDEFGVSIIIVEQNLARAFSLSDRIYFIKSGLMAMCEEPRNLDMNRVKELFLA